MLRFYYTSPKPRGSLKIAVLVSTDMKLSQFVRLPYLLGRVAKSLPDPGEEFVCLLEEVTAAQSLVDQCADLVRMENSNAVHNTMEALSVDERDRFEKLKLLLKDIDEPIQRMTNQLKNVEDHLDSMFKAYRLK